MADVPPDRVQVTPKSDEAVIVFMRPSSLGFAVQSVVYDVTGETPQLVGIVSSGKKIAHRVAPGRHRFMVVSESADFADADVEKGRTYYMLVTPRVGLWRARFSLRPVTKMQLGDEQFKEWFQGTNWVENTPESHQWSRENMQSVRTKMSDNLTQWLNKDQRPALRPDDGE